MVKNERNKEFRAYQDAMEEKYPHEFLFVSVDEKLYQDAWTDDRLGRDFGYAYVEFSFIMRTDGLARYNYTVNVADEEAELIFRLKHG